MSRRPSKQPDGATIEAPDEQGFVPGEKAKAPPRGANRPRAEPALQATPASAWKSLLAALKVASGILVVLAASGTVAWGAYRYALTTPRFAVRKVEIEGSRRLPDERLIKLAQVELGRNIFQLDTAEAERRVLADPWVREVKITRKLPNTIRMDLVEREAVALAAISEALYLVTKSGEPFKRLEPADPYDLPVITGISAHGLARDRQLEVQRIGEALELVRSYERLPQSRVHHAQEVHLGEDGAATLTVGDRAISLQLGKGPWRKKLLMAGRVLEQLGKKGRSPGIVFLDNQAHPERVVVRLK